MRMAYSPATGLVYVPTMQMATRFHRGAPEDDDFNVFGVNVASVGGEPGDGKGSLVAWDPVAQKARWRAPLDTLWNGGALPPRAMSYSRAPRTAGSPPTMRAPALACGARMSAWASSLRP